MRRKDRAKDRDFCLALIDGCTHGVLAVADETGGAYCVPLSFVRVGEALYFHCAQEGRKVDLLRRSPKVCVTFVGEDRPAFVPPAMYTTYFSSAIVTGTAAEVTALEEKAAALRALCEKMTPGRMEGFGQALKESLPATGVWKIAMEEISGKAKTEG